MRAALPASEAERLQTLRAYDILDTPAETAFDRIVSLTSQIFGVPMATVSLVDMDRDWLKACFGIDAREASRELSFCAHALLQEDVMVVRDALDDARFSGNPHVTGPPHIRFYAGAPLRAPDGNSLGSLCLMDTRPRDFSDRERAMLENLAQIVVDEMELRRTGRKLRESEAALRHTMHENSRLATAVDNVASGVVMTDPTRPGNPITFANPGFYAMTGYSADEVIGRNCRFLQGRDTDPATIAAISEAIAERRPFAGLVSNYRRDGTTFVNELRINPVYDENGELLTFVGLQNDVTGRERAKELLETRVSERTAELAQSQIEILKRLARAAEFRDDDTGQHTIRVARTTALIAAALGLPSEQVDLMREAAPLHDVGKIAIPDGILLKPGKLTDEEFTTMRSHAALGAALLSQGRSEVVQVAERIAGSHHERWDGQGYPQRLSGESIPLEARIVSVADVFDALTHDRPYKRAWSVADAVAEIAAQRARQFDPSAVDAFLTLAHGDLL